MRSGERIVKIFELINEKKYLTVAELAEQFEVSAMTIRRDLAKLESQGVITTNYGGATLNEGVSAEPSFGIKSGQSQEYKDQIAYEASFLVNDGDSIYIDCGTTALELVKYIVGKRITIITNSWRVVSEIQDFSKVKILLAPGEYDPISEGALSSATISFMQNYVIDKAFISTQGADLEGGVTVPTDNDAQVKKAVMKASKQKILLADHTKFGQTFLAKHGEISDFDAVITDSQINPAIYEQLRKKCHNIIKSTSYLKRKISESKNESVDK